MAIVTQSIEGVSLTTIYAVPYDQTAAGSATNDPSIPAFPFTQGTEVTGTDGSIWMFTSVNTSATLAQYNVVMIDPLTFKSSPILGGGAAETTKMRVGFYQNATSATAGQGCWVMIAGQPTITVLGSCAKSVQLYTTDTSGKLDDAIATGSQYPVRNVFILTTVGSTATFTAATASWPSVGPLGALL